MGGSAVFKGLSSQMLGDFVRGPRSGNRLYSSYKVNPTVKTSPTGQKKTYEHVLGSQEEKDTRTIFSKPARRMAQGRPTGSNGSSTVGFPEESQVPSAQARQDKYGKMTAEGKWQYPGYYEKPAAEFMASVEPPSKAVALAPKAVNGGTPILSPFVQYQTRGRSVKRGDAGSSSPHIRRRRLKGHA